MDLPDLRGYELDSHICWTPTRLAILWFSKTELEAQLWQQVQVTLVGARLSMASVEIVGGFPALKSYEVSERKTAQGNRLQFELRFDRGEMSFECESIAYSVFSREIRFVED
jgi:hypothetical protein